VNLHDNTVESFGYEWTQFDQSNLDDAELDSLFGAYFDIFPWGSLPADAVGFDLGCGSGRWAKRVAPRVGRLHCIDASAAAVGAAQRTLAGQANCEYHVASVEAIPLPDAAADFGYSLGVLHHVPDTAAGLAVCVKKLRPGAPFLLYLYYNLENRPVWYRLLWRMSDTLRRMLSACPLGLKHAASTLIALTVYWPLARIALLLEHFGLPVDSLPLSFYRRRSFFVMRTDAFDRFATPLEKRFGRGEIERMMRVAGLERITFSESPPFYHALGYRQSGGSA
jgi:SAM-dependent methyltransferase